MEPVLVLSADLWEIPDESTGEIRSGVTLNFVNQYREATDKSVGFRPTKVPATAEVFNALRAGGAPGWYRLSFRTRPGKEGKPVLTAGKAELIRKLELFDARESSSPDRKGR